MQVAPLPTEDELRRAYAQAASDEYADEEGGQRATASALLERIEAHVAPGRILDVGCWLGFLLGEARERGWEPVGIEPSETASAAARERFGLDVRTGGVGDVPAGRFEAVVMGDVIEHLVDPAAALSRVRGALADGGVLALALPDAGSRLARAMGRRWWSVLPTHVQYFTRASLTRLLVREGFEVLEVDTAPKAFSVRYYLGRVEGYSPRAGRALVAAAERARLADRLWAPDFRDRMLVLARPAT
jgi:SAM-dependent methyltransferase